MVAIKFIFQLKLFSSIFEEEKYSEFIHYLYNYKIGIQYFDEGFGTNFFKYISF